MRPTNTQEGRLWLDNFSGPERDAASKLLDSVRFVSATRFQAGLGALLRRVLLREVQAPAAIYAVRPSLPIPYNYVEPQTAATPIENAGSEYIVENVINNVLKEPKLRAYRAQTLQELRQKRVRGCPGPRGT